MDFLKLGLRTLIGVTLPGAILVTVVLCELCAVQWAILAGPIEPEWVKALAELVKALVLPGLAILFIMSYLVGSFSRIKNVEGVDEIAGERLKEQYDFEDRAQTDSTLRRWFLHFARFFDKKAKKDNDDKELVEFNERKMKLLLGDSLPATLNAPGRFDLWLKCTEQFPYPAWAIRSLSLCHPPDMARTLSLFRNLLGNTDKESCQKEFFLFCQMTVRCLRTTVGDALLDEMDTHEALVRFYAGTYFALRYSRITIGLFVLAIVVASFVRNGASLTGTLVESLIVSAGVYLVFWWWQEGIVQRFRLLRLREVALVFDAFYLALAFGGPELRERLLGPEQNKVHGQPTPLH